MRHFVTFIKQRHYAIIRTANEGNFINELSNMSISLSSASNSRSKTKFWLSIWLSFMLLLVSILHTVELHFIHYTQSTEIILIEITLLFVVICLSIGHLVLSFYYGLNHNKPSLNISLDCFFITLSALILAIFIDIHRFV